MTEKLIKFDHIPTVTNYHAAYQHGNFRFRVTKDGEGYVTLERRDKAGRRHVIEQYLSEEGLLALWAGLTQYVVSRGLDAQVETRDEYEARIREQQKQAELDKEAWLANRWPG